LNQDSLLAGIDEAGRGPLAGPVTAACVVFPPEYRNPLITDSKKLTAKVREKLFPEIKSAALAYAVICVGPRRIEELNIREATRLAMTLSAKRVIQIIANRGLGERQLAFQIDGDILLSMSCQQETIIKGDQKVMAIGAASILAKVTRDQMMDRLESFYPGYEFSKHKGYPTKSHREKIGQQGPCRIHRRTFGGVREFVFLGHREIQETLL